MPAEWELILVTAISSTPAGESIRLRQSVLCDALNHIGKKGDDRLRGAFFSGPVFGMKRRALPARSIPMWSRM